jgi:hypothetical protein
MALKLFGNLNTEAVYVILLSVLGIMWYTALWGIFDDISEEIYQRYKISKYVQRLTVVAFILIIVFSNPKILGIL